MKIKILFAILISLSAITFFSCDDDLNKIGGNIQPEGDSIYVNVDTFRIKASTISMRDSIYARTAFGMIGDYSDPVFGKIKADFFTELYTPEGSTFLDNIVKIDSVQVLMYINSYTGDSKSPLGISVYEVNNPLAQNFYTNMNPKKYCDMTKLLGQKTVIPKELSVYTDSYTSTSLKYTRINLDTLLAKRFIQEWKRDSTTFQNSNKFKEFFRGMYFTSTLGSSCLLNLGATFFEINYKFKGRNYDNTKDSIKAAIFRLSVTEEVIQMNHIENDTPSDLLGYNGQKAYIKSPAGLCTELSIPLKRIMNNIGTGKTINSALFNPLGYSEDETASNLPRSSTLLLVNKDSIGNFFQNKGLTDSKTSFIVSRTSSGNVYSFGNIAVLLNHYITYYKDMDESKIPENLIYYLVPVTIGTTYNSTTGAYMTTGIYNQLSPSSAILRADTSSITSNMYIPIVYSNYQNRK